ncbi:MAG: hypothetical protein HXY30_01130 [Pseudorhodoplanes sp.]|nr:hypothetical protein [Pseudorhodoplanes sp.]
MTEPKQPLTGIFLTRRRWLAMAAAFSTMAAAPVLAGSDMAEAVKFVREVYEEEAARHRDGERVTDVEFLTVFTRDVRALWLTGKNRQFPIPLPIGPKLHAFFGWGVLPGQTVSITRVIGAAEGRNMVDVSVEMTIRGEPRRVLVRTQRESGAWRIANLLYDRGEDFVSYRRKLAGH